MKKLVLSMLAGMMVLGAMAQEGIFTVRGTFDWEKDTVSFVLVNPVMDMKVKKAKHAITGEMIEQSFDFKRINKSLKFYGIEHPEDALMLYVVFKNGNKTYMTVPAIAGETVEFYREGEPVTRFRGSQFYIDYNEAEQSIEAPLIELMNCLSEIWDKQKKGAPQKEIDKLSKEYEKKYDVYYSALTDYVKAHPDQDASAALIATIGETYTTTTVEDIEAAAALLTERARNSKAAGLYKVVLEPAKKKKEETDRQQGLVGNMAPDFTLNDINGNPLALSSLRGKWVIIDFWGSWCVWCIKGMPQMKEYYAKYRDKVEILGVDCNDTEEKWKEAVDKHELPWLHVYCAKTGDNPVALYTVTGFPTKVVIDPEGKVAKIISGEDPSFYEYLDEVLK